MKIGDKVWMYNDGRRVYRQRKGRSFGSPIYREHFEPRFIVGETRVSWLIGREDQVGKELSDWDKSRLYKLAKKGDKPFGVMLSEGELDQHVWVHENAYRLADAVRACKDYSVMKKIAELVGYKDPTGESCGENCHPACDEHERGG